MANRAHRPLSTLYILSEHAPLSFAEAGKLVGVPRQTIEQAVKSGNLQSIEAGPYQLVIKKDVLTYKDNRPIRGRPWNKPRKCIETQEKIIAE